MKLFQRLERVFQLVLVLAILFVINVLAYNFSFGIDLTGDKRFTLTEATKNLLNNQKDPIYVKVLLDGDFPAGFSRLQAASQEMLEKFRNVNDIIEYEFEDPTYGTVEETNRIKQELSKDGINPVSLTVRDGDDISKKLIYPFAIFNYGNRNVVVNLLESQSAGLSDEVVLNNSVSLLEYKFSDAIQKLNLTEKPNILITEGNGELLDPQLASLTTALKSFYNFGRINLDSVYKVGEEADLLIVAAPKKVISDRSKFKIDQYLMNGGRIIWLMEKLEVSLDSINRNKFYVPPVIENDLDNQLFRYGVRIQPNLVLDLESSQIEQVVGIQGGEEQTELFRWYYHPLVASTSMHPMVKNLDRVNMFFPSTIDTVKTKTAVKKTVLLKSSPYSRFQMYPMRLNFEILKYAPDQTKFDKGPQNVAVLLEGTFESFFKNRVTSDMEQVLSQINSTFKEQSTPTKQLVVSDADFAKNLYDPNSNRITPIGLNRWEQKVYPGNADFIFNAIEYMLDENGVLASRSKEVKLRLLDRVKAKQEKLKWQLINIGLPILLLLLFGGLYNYMRRRKYAS